ncbi:YIP1 family protein [Ruegeria meonggei]|uniref:YIP1 family protein n=1 Tax=Ruegeria meonggei TaxID=1446476 RepID=UPI00366FEE33
MNFVAFANLAVLTLTNPVDAARQLMAIRPGREVLWLAFFLAVVLNCLVQVGLGNFIPTPAGQALPPPDPIYLILIRSAGAIFLSIMTFLFFGRLLGGVGSFDDIMILTVWLQYLQIAAQFLILIVTIQLPFLMLMFLLATAVLSLYVTLHFLNEAHKFGSLWKSFGVILLSGTVALLFVLMLSPAGPV